MPDIEMPPNIHDAWVDLTRWKIDVTAEDNENFYIIEIKPNANAKAVGQALAYARLWSEEMKPAKPVIPVVLTDMRNPITADCAVSDTCDCCTVKLWIA